jgi:hypothetical protein
MRIYQMTSIGDAEASSPTANPSPAKRVLYYLRKRTNRAASDDMIANFVFGGDKANANSAIRKLINANAVKAIGG